MGSLFVRSRSILFHVSLAAALLLTLPCAWAADPCVDSPPPAVSDGRSVDALIAAGERAIASGLMARGLGQLATAARLAAEGDAPKQQAEAFGAYGHGLLLAGDKAQAKACLDASLDLARAHGLTDLEALAHLNAGTLLTLDEERSDAVESFTLALDKARQAERPDLAARILLNRSRLYLDVVNNAERAAEDLDQAASWIERLGRSAEKAGLLLALGTLRSERAATSADAFPEDRLAYAALSDARQLADDLDLPTVRSSALGHMAALYARQLRNAEALRLLDQAVIDARTANAPGLAYRWYWDRARLHVTMADHPQALADYEHAVDVMTDLRRRDAFAGAVFGQTPLGDAQRLFDEYVDLLFAADRGPLNEDDLARIQRTVEKQRQVEVESYFQDDCVADLRRRMTEIQALTAPDAGVAFLYPIFANDRLILMTNVAGRLSYRDVAVTEAMVRRDAQRVRRSLEDKQARPSEYLPPLQRLYEVLIRPITSMLDAAEVQTLVIVPSGAIRGVPFAALHDGARFLVRRYATAIAPGLSLLDSDTTAQTPFAALLGGLTEPVGGYDRLPFAEEEIEGIRELRGGTVLKGGSFETSELQKSLAAIPYSVVHIASHAEFGGAREETFIVTQDGRLDLDRLEDLIKPSAFREHPVELLTLSACQTAAGDDLERAALGLAGIAVKSGARSALGTLWPVYDESSPVFMVAFYENIGPAGLSKAKALQAAQIGMLESDRFTHPAFWAPYLLIGNWR